MKKLIGQIVSHIKSFLSKGHPRSLNLKRNIGASFLLKAFAIVLGLIKVPILLSYLNADKYGVWLTIASILEWINIFDLGLGHGFRNRFAEAIAKNDSLRARGLVSTAYISLSVIVLLVSLIAIPAILLIDWQKLLNAKMISGEELRITMLMVTVVFMARFVLQLVSVMLKALQKSALSDVFIPVSSLVSLFLIVVLKDLVKDSLFWASAVIAIPIAVILLGANVIAFAGKYRQYCPSISLYDKHYLKDIYSLGWKFFVGQITGLCLFGTSNIILSNAVGPSEVTIYNIANKYFSFPVSYFMIIVTPYWSAVTDAFFKNEFDWIKRNMRKLIQMATLFCAGLALMLLLSKPVFHCWIQDRVHIPLSLSVAMTVYNMTVMYMAPYNMFLNGFGKLKLGTNIAIIKTIAYLPLAWFLASKYGALGLVLALFIANMLPNLLTSIKQYSLVVNQKAYGIWDE